MCEENMSLCEGVSHCIIVFVFVYVSCFARVCATWALCSRFAYVSRHFRTFRVRFMQVTFAFCISMGFGCVSYFTCLLEYVCFPRVSLAFLARRACVFRAFRFQEGCLNKESHCTELSSASSMLSQAQFNAQVQMAWHLQFASCMFTNIHS